MQKKSNKRFIIAITIAVLIPLLFCLITGKFTWGRMDILSWGHIKLPRYYIAEGVDSSMVKGKMHYDTTYHRVADLVLTNQLGQTVSLNKDLEGKILVINFFFVNCPTVCPHLTRNVAYLNKAFKKNDSIAQFISITVNPGHDTFQVLRQYADKYKANHDHWWFLTGDKKTIYDYARNQLFVEGPQGDGGADDFIHTQKIVLVDKYRHIRGYYDGLDSTEIKRCADDIVLLWSEKHPKQ